MLRQLWGATLAILATLMPARAGAEGNIRLPRLFNPPPPRAQVAEAQIWDPYPLPGLANATDRDGRPRDFFYPPPQATRGRYPNPGTFPRPAPWVRSSAPADYPNIHKRLKRKWAEEAVSEERVSGQESIDAPAPAQAAPSAKKASPSAK